MNPKRIFVATSLMIMLCATLVAGKTGIISDLMSLNLFNRVKAPVNAVTDPQIAYEILFRKLVKFEKVALEKENNKENATYLRTYITRQYGLTSEQSQDLQAIANETIANLAENENNAYTIISDFRSQFPSDDGTAGAATLPTPPPSLAILQTEREQIILKGRDRFLTSLGESASFSFEMELQKQTQVGLRPVMVTPPNQDARGE